jgi:glycosyltransferase involved in cell wall biosynthesis
LSLLSSTFPSLARTIDTVLYTAAHGGFAGQAVPLGGGAAIANLLCDEWSRSKPFDLKLLGPAILGPAAPSARDIVSFNERRYAAFCESFREASTREALKHDPARTAILVNDISEGPDFERLARTGFRIVTIYHVDVVAYIASIYLRGWVRPETLTRWWERLRRGVPGRVAPTILRLIFEQQRASLLWSERVIVPSSDMKSIMLRCYPETPPDRIEVLPWGCPPLPSSTENEPKQSRDREGAVDTRYGLSASVPDASGEPSLSHSSKAFQPPPSFETQGAGAAALRAEYGIEPGAHVLLCLSRISPEKGQDFLLKTLIEWEKSPSFPARPIWLFICGAAAFMNGQGYERRLKALAGRLKKVHVVFPGYVAGTRKLAFLSLAHIYLFPSSHESYGLTLVEALSCGLPAICRDHAGARQILTPDFGFIVSGSGPSARLAFRKAMEKVLLDDSLRNSMARSASTWASRRPFSHSAARLAALLAGAG